MFVNNILLQISFYAKTLQVNVRLFSTKFEGWCKYFSPTIMRLILVSLRKLAPSRNVVYTWASSIRLPSFKPWRTRYGSVNYGISSYWPHSHKVQTKLYKIPKVGVNRPKRKQDTAVWKCQNLQRNEWPSGRWLPYFSLLILTFIAVSQSKLAWLTPNLGILWISVCSFWLCGSIVANPIIYRLVSSPSRFETRQWHGLCHWISSVKPWLLMKNFWII